MITSSRSLTGKTRQLSERVAAVLSSTPIENASYVSNDVLCTLACMAAGVTSFCISQDAIIMGLYTAEDLCEHYKVDPAVYKPIIAAFRDAAPNIRVFPESF
jgi:hypothetical protein